MVYGIENQGVIFEVLNSLNATTFTDASIAALVERWESGEAAEGIAAFFDRRPAAWTESGGD